MVALNDAIADGRDVSWIWDVDFEPLLERVGRVVVSGERAAELALRCRTADFPTIGSRSSPTSSERSTAGWSWSVQAAELVVLPTYTAMLALRAIAPRARARAPVLGGRAA